MSNLPDPLIVMALELEAGEVFQRAGVPVLFTGIGKVNAAYALTRRLAEYRHAGAPMPHVINFGTAGSNRFPTGALVACRWFIQRDMDVSGLGFPVGATPYEDVPAELEFPMTVFSLIQAPCSTGDSFQTCSDVLPCDVRDMEAYALAKICWLEKARFSCVKFITDGADHAAANDWRDNVDKAAVEFLRIYRELTQG